MQSGRGGMGMTKHGKSGLHNGKSGKGPKSPRLRHSMKLEAERAQAKKPRARLAHNSVPEAIKSEQPR